MPDIATSENLEECAKPVDPLVENGTQERKDKTNNDIYKELAVSTLLSAIKTVDQLFGPFTIANDEKEKKEPFFPEVKVSKAEIKSWSKFASAEKVEAIKREINEYGRDPKDAILDAVKNNRVVAVGDGSLHNVGLRVLLETAAPDLAKSGATHIAVPINPKFQKILERASSGDREAARKLERFGGPYNEFDTRMLKAMADAGIKGVAAGGDESDRAARIAKIIESDPKAKVLFYTDIRDLRMTADGPMSVGDQLKEQGKKVGYSVSTFGTYYETDDRNGEYLAKNTARPFSIAMAQTTHLKNIPSESGRNSNDMIMGDHDQALFLPDRTAVEAAELAYGPNSPKIVPALDHLAMNHGRNAKLEKGKARDLFQWALEIEKKNYGEYSLPVASRYDLLSQIPGQSQMEYLDKSIAIGEKLISSGEQDRPLLEHIKVLGRAAFCSFGLGNQEKMLDYIKQGNHFADANNEVRSAWKDTTASLLDLAFNTEKLEAAEKLLSVLPELKRESHWQRRMADSYKAYNQLEKAREWQELLDESKEKMEEEE